MKVTSFLPALLLGYLPGTTVAQPIALLHTPSTPSARSTSLSQAIGNLLAAYQTSGSEAVTPELRETYANALFFATWTDVIPFIQPYYKSYAAECSPPPPASSPNNPFQTFASEADLQSPPASPVSCFAATQAVNEGTHRPVKPHRGHPPIQLYNYKNVPNFETQYPLLWAVFQGFDELALAFFKTVAHLAEVSGHEIPLGSDGAALMVFAMARDIVRVAVVENRIDTLGKFIPLLRHWTIKASTVLLRSVLEKNPVSVTDSDIASSSSSAASWSSTNSSNGSRRHPRYRFNPLVDDTAAYMADSYMVVLYAWAHELEAPAEMTQFLASYIIHIHDPFMHSLLEEAQRHNLHAAARAIASLLAVKDGALQVHRSALFTKTVWREFAHFNPILSFDPQRVSEVLLPSY
ncbi:hypothetical protein BJ085DRAFT_31540 [Dimargaris cristalligena]|uniref:Uncharacterized protein n=1 Tax=Dimargaris cristalligena TaxID=215637 RepID=A0A4P9ZVA2_9FUNG|nr:hypothetical protein BJ085DRAFT_31540 [Dimargaris cristalligena]|eukprot:RKP36762.1 hypothetical protein BJ085DRAFT_31540 [Dimargaris cristalligena]